jgi:hypothetical protein
MRKPCRHRPTHEYREVKTGGCDIGTDDEKTDLVAKHAAAELSGSPISGSTLKPTRAVPGNKQRLPSGGPSKQRANPRKRNHP